MSRVLKMDRAADAAGIRSVQSAFSVERQDVVPGVAAIDPELVALREERAGLQLRLEQKDTEISELRKQAEGAFRKGEAQGRDAGMREAADHGLKLVTRLEGGVAVALKAFAQALSSLERLAPVLASQGLASIFEDSKARSALVRAIVQRQLKLVATDAIVHIEVSSADFVDDAALTSLAESVGDPRLSLRALSNLKSGDCRIKLTLGTLEVGVDQQWGRLSAILQDLSEPIELPQ